jgi:stearoyl-CoA desaturase (delta-9 desaturase)
MWGEGWHNNHHKNQKNENFSVKWWEFDISYHIIKLIRIKNVVNK